MNSTGDSPNMGLSPLEFYQTVYDNLPHGVIVIRNDKIFYANRAISELLGYPIDDILKWPTTELFKPFLTRQEELQSLYESGEGIVADSVSHQYQIADRDGKVRHIEMIPIRFSMYGDEYHHAMFLDVTDRVSAIQEMKESEERFRNTFDSIPEPAYLWEQNDKGRIVLKMANKHIVSISGGFVNQHLGEEPNELFFDNPEFAEYIRLTMYSGQSIRTETTISHNRMPTLSTIIVDCVKPAENLVLMIHTDITKERQAQETARKSEREKSIILDSMRDHLVYYDSPDLKISWSNKAAADALNLTPADLVGKYCYKLWQGRSEPCVDCSVLGAWKTGLPQVGEVRTPDNRIWLVKGLPVKNIAEKVTSVVEVTREITAEKESERMIQEAKGRAELYLDLVSHDLNNIHQGIIIGLELALENRPISNDLQTMLQTILEQVNRAVSLITNVQKFSTIIDSPTNLAEVELFPIFEAALKFVRNTFPQRELHVNLNIPEENIIVIADEFLGDAIFNLLHNTMKHDENKIVRIDVTIEKNESYVVFQLDDKGPGLNDELKRNLFGYPGYGMKKGSGIGLTLVKRIVDRYHGKIVVEDRVPGDHTQGASFKMLIPRQRESGNTLSQDS